MIVNPLLLTLSTFSKTLSTSMVQPSLALYLEPKHLICTFICIADQMIGFIRKTTRTEMG